MKRMISGNQAIAYGALNSGIEVAAGYPGTPSTETLTEILKVSGKAGGPPYAEWSTNEKVALEVAAGAAWAGKRALVTMKMSGMNVALDSLISIAYSGTRGGMVIYIADDPGAEAGMPEQDSRYFAQIAGLPLLEPAGAQSVLELTSYAFDLSEKIELPVIIRLVTSVAHGVTTVEADYSYHALKREALFERDIEQYTKAGSAICLNQHHQLLDKLKAAGEQFSKDRINRLKLVDGHNKKGLFAVSSGVLNRYLDEALPSWPGISTLQIEAPYPLEEEQIREMLSRAGRIVIFEELEPIVESMIRGIASKSGWQGTILGKFDGLLPQIGRYSGKELRIGLEALSCSAGEGGGTTTVQSVLEKNESLYFEHSITFCPGCPHRGTYEALNRALKKLKLKREEIIVTGDIGCTILGMNPPFNSCWTEVSMGSSIGLAQGFSRAGVKKPVIAAIGDSTFFHGGIPQLINAVQHRTDILVIILDNGWTSMTGFQVNPGTDEKFQQAESRRVDIFALVKALGVDYLKVIKPFDQEGSIAVICEAIESRGVRVVIAREECALPPLRRGERKAVLHIDPDKCTFCRRCLRESGCPVLSVDIIDGKQVMTINPFSCTGCGLCATSCSFGAIL